MVESSHSLERIKYFKLKDFIEKIKVNSNVLAHMEETNEEFDKYMNTLAQFKEKDVLNWWLSQSYNDILESNKIENHYITRQEMVKSDIMEKVVKKPLTHETIEKLHQFAIQDKKAKREKYRVTEVRHSTLHEDGTEEIFWYGVEPEDIYNFMEDFLSVYNTKNMSVIDSNPILNSALIHLLFVRIHPFRDGNSRTARMLQSIKFTESLNRLYGKKYCLCPISLSESIYMNRYTYSNRITSIIFDPTVDNNKAINQWFDFMLNMVDEQLHHRQTHLDNLEAAQLMFDNQDEKMLEEIKKLRLK